MTNEQLIALIRGRFGSLFHFTDNRNLPSVRQHGLLSRSELARRGVNCAAFGGNQWSRDADDDRGLDGYVHLCFFKSHPMEYRGRQRQDERLGETTFLAIDPQILTTAGVVYCDQVSNRAGSELISVTNLPDRFDMEVLFTQMNWRDSSVQPRLQSAKKYEVLVPDSIALPYIRF